MLTSEDRKILRVYQSNPQMTLHKVSELVGMSNAAVTRRISDLRQRGYIKRVRAIINWKALGYEIEVSLRVRFDKTSPRALDEISTAARAIEEVIEIQTFIGQVELRLGVIAQDLLHYQELYRTKILTLPHLADIEALMHVGRIKNDRGLPL